MKRLTLALAISLLASAHLTAQITPADVEAQKSSTTSTHAHLVSSLATQAASTLGMPTYRNTVGPAGQHAPAVSIREITRTTKTAIDEHDFGVKIAKGSSFVLKSSVGAALTTANPIVGSIVGDGFSTALDMATDAFDQAGREQVQKSLKTKLDAYRVATSQQEYDALLASPDPKTFRRDLEAKVGSVFDTDLDSLPEDQQRMVNSFYDRQVANIFTAGLAKVSEFQAAQGEEIQANRKNIQGLALAFQGYVESTATQLEGIAETQRELQSGLQTLNDRIGNTESGVAFLQNAMFSKMSPAEQVAALKSGIFPDMPPADRQDLEEKISVVAKRQELVDKVGTYLNGARDLTNIARNLGVDGEVLSKANQAVDIGQHALNAFTAFSSGNYLSALSAVSNVMGVGGPDVAGERHNEIMGAFDKVFSQLHVMDGKLNEIIDNQHKMMQTQALILENIVALATQVQQNHSESMQRLHELHTDVLYNRQLMVSEATKNYSKCGEILKINGNRIIDTSKRKLPSSSQFNTLYLNKRARLLDCMEQLEGTREEGEGFRTAVFALQSREENPESNIKPYLAEVFGPAWAILSSTKLTSDGKTVAQRTTSLFAPTTTVAGLNAKLAIVTAENPSRFGRPVVELMPKALAAQMVFRHGSYATDVHYYHLLLDAFDRPRPLSELYHAQELRTSGHELLLEALTLTDVAIAQQTMLAGDALLPPLFEALTRFATAEDTADKAIHLAAVHLLQKNSVLAENLVLFAVRNHVESKSNFSTYFVALSGNDKNTLQSVVGDAWDLRFSEIEVREGDSLKIPKGWAVAIGTELFALPGAEVLMAGELKEPDDLRRLVSLRHRILEELSGYEIYDSSNAAVRRQLNGMIMRTMGYTTGL